MKNEQTQRRTLIQRLFRAGLGRNLITIWVEEKGVYGLGQIETETRVQLGRFTVLRWSRFFTPAIKPNDLDG
jgi:hypothetical protein